MSVRGGYGLAFDRLMNLPAENYRHSPPLRATVVLGQFFGTPQFTYSLGDPSKPYLGYPVDPALQVGLDERNGVKGARVALTTVDPNLVNPYTHNWFLGAQREIGWNVVAEFNYLGSSGHNLYNAYNQNRFVGDLIDGTFNGFNPSFQQINMVTSTSKSNYQGGTVSLRRNFLQGWTLQGAYTFGKAMNDADIAVGTTNFQDAADLGAEWAIAGYDVRHKLALLGVWEMPFFKDNTGLTRTLLGGWQIAGSAIFQTGNPINITRGGSFPTGDYNADGNGGDDQHARDQREDERVESGRVPGWHFQRVRLPGAGARYQRQSRSQRLPWPRLRGREPVALEEVRADAEGHHGGSRRRVQRAEPGEFVGPGHGSGQLELREGHVAAEHAGDSARGAGAVLTRGSRLRAQGSGKTFVGTWSKGFA